MNSTFNLNLTLWLAFCLCIPIFPLPLSLLLSVSVFVLRFLRPLTFSLPLLPNRFPAWRGKVWGLLTRSDGLSVASGGRPGLWRLLSRRWTQGTDRWGSLESEDQLSVRGSKDRRRNEPSAANWRARVRNSPSRRWSLLEQHWRLGPRGYTSGLIRTTSVKNIYHGYEGRSCGNLNGSTGAMASTGLLIVLKRIHRQLNSFNQSCWSIGRPVREVC